MGAARWCVVTGASTGIGRASVLALDRAGFRVFAGVRQAAAGDALRAEASERLEPVLLDVTDEGQVAAARERVSEAVGDAGLAGLMNNAGIAVNAPMEFIPIADLRRQLEVNVVGQVAVTQAFLPLLRRAKGRIVFTGSTSGFLTLPLAGPYSMSKHSIESMADALRMELRPWGIHVAVLRPGAIATPIWEKALSEGDEFLEQSSADLQELYGGLIGGMREAAVELAAQGSPPEAVARVAVHALTSRRPKTHYLVGKNGRLERVLSLLPARLRDYVLLKALGIK
ncbi:MAG: SDR family oxidoreductase [Phycisphaerae bacterium]|nr:SDR family oxidoreductase [Phycisphaerae bacterium]